MMFILNMSYITYKKYMGRIKRETFCFLTDYVGFYINFYLIDKQGLL